MWGIDLKKRASSKSWLCLIKSITFNLCKCRKVNRTWSALPSAIPHFFILSQMCAEGSKVWNDNAMMNFVNTHKTRSVGLDSCRHIQYQHWNTAWKIENSLTLKFVTPWRLGDDISWWMTDRLRANVARTVCSESPTHLNNETAEVKQDIEKEIFQCWLYIKYSRLSPWHKSHSQLSQWHKSHTCHTWYKSWCICYIVSQWVTKYKTQVLRYIVTLWQWHIKESAVLIMHFTHYNFDFDITRRRKQDRVWNNYCTQSLRPPKPVKSSWNKSNNSQLIILIFLECLNNVTMSSSFYLHHAERLSPSAVDNREDRPMLLL